MPRGNNSVLRENKFNHAMRRHERQSSGKYHAELTAPTTSRSIVEPSESTHHHFSPHVSSALSIPS